MGKPRTKLPLYVTKQVIQRQSKELVVREIFDSVKALDAGDNRGTKRPPLNEWAQVRKFLPSSQLGAQGLEQLPDSRVQKKNCNPEEDVPFNSTRRELEVECRPQSRNSDAGSPAVSRVERVPPNELTFNLTEEQDAVQVLNNVEGKNMRFSQADDTAFDSQLDGLFEAGAALSIFDVSDFMTCSKSAVRNDRHSNELDSEKLISPSEKHSNDSHCFAHPSDTVKSSSKSAGNLPPTTETSFKTTAIKDTQVCQKRSNLASQLLSSPERKDLQEGGLLSFKPGISCEIGSDATASSQRSDFNFENIAIATTSGGDLKGNSSPHEFCDQAYASPRSPVLFGAVSQRTSQVEETSRPRPSLLRKTPGFASAGGKPLFVSSKSLEKAKTMFEQCSDASQELLRQSPPRKLPTPNNKPLFYDEKSLFATASGSDLPISTTNLRSAKTMFDACQESTNNTPHIDKKSNKELKSDVVESEEKENCSSFMNVCFDSDSELFHFVETPPKSCWASKEKLLSPAKSVENCSQHSIEPRTAKRPRLSQDFLEQSPSRSVSRSPVLLRSALLEDRSSSNNYLEGSFGGAAPRTSPTIFNDSSTKFVTQKKNSLIDASSQFVTPISGNRSPTLSGEFTFQQTPLARSKSPFESQHHSLSRSKAADRSRSPVLLDCSFQENNEPAVQFKGPHLEELLSVSVDTPKRSHCHNPQKALLFSSAGGRKIAPNLNRHKAMLADIAEDVNAEVLGEPMEKLNVLNTGKSLRTTESFTPAANRHVDTPSAGNLEKWGLFSDEMDVIMASNDQADGESGEDANSRDTPRNSRSPILLSGPIAEGTEDSFWQEERDVMSDILELSQKEGTILSTLGIVNRSKPMMADIAKGGTVEVAAGEIETLNLPNIRKSLPRNTDGTTTSFTTAAGRHIKPTAGNMEKWKQLFSVEEETLLPKDQTDEVNAEVAGETLPGSSSGITASFTTAAGKHVKPSAETLEKWKQQFSDEVSKDQTDEDNVEVAGKISDVPNSRNSFPGNAGVATVSFTTAAGRHVKPSTSSLEKWKQLFSDEPETIAPKDPTDGQNAEVAGKTLPGNSGGTTASFTTAAGRNIKPSTSSLEKWKQLFSDEDKTLISEDQQTDGKNAEMAGKMLDVSNTTKSFPGISGGTIASFTTTAGRHVNPSTESLEKWKQLFSDEPESLASKDQNDGENAEVTGNSDGTTASFTTAAGRHVKPSTSSLEKWKQLFSDEPESLASKDQTDGEIAEVAGTSLPGNSDGTTASFTTAAGRHVKPSTSSLEKWKQLFRDEPEMVVPKDQTDEEIAEVARTSLPGNSGGTTGSFTTAGGKHVKPSAGSLDKWKQLYSDESETLYSKHPTDGQSAENAGKSLPGKSGGTAASFTTATGRHFKPSAENLKQQFSDEDGTVAPEFHSDEKNEEGARGPLVERADDLCHHEKSNHDIRGTSNFMIPKKCEVPLASKVRASLLTESPSEMVVSSMNKVSDEVLAHFNSTMCVSVDAAPSKTGFSSSEANNSGFESWEEFPDLKASQATLLEKSAVEKASSKEIIRQHRRIEEPTKSGDGNECNLPVKRGSYSLDGPSGPALEVQRRASSKLATAGHTPAAGTARKRKYTSAQQSTKRSKPSLPFAKSLELQELLQTKARLREEQNRTILAKRSQHVQPLPGKLYHDKKRTDRLPLKCLDEDMKTIDENRVVEMTVSLSVFDISSESSVNFRFRRSREDDSGRLLGDNCLFVSADDGSGGLKEIASAFLTSPNVDPKLITDGWIENHYRWIVWKLACVERTFPQRFSSCVLSVENVLLQLKYRYDREIDMVQRSAFRKMLEGDAAPNKFICCIAAVRLHKEDSVTEFELTDGWYSIWTTVDSEMCELLRRDVVGVGTKLVVHNAELTNCEQGCDPLNVPSDVKMKISTNSVRRVKWYAKMGFTSNNDPIPGLLCSILPNGGFVGRVMAVVVRKYPVIYMCKDGDGKTVFRSERSHAAFREQQEKNKSEKAEQAYEQIWKEVESKYRSTNKCSKKYSTNELLNVTDPEILYNLVAEADDECIPSQLSTEQLKLATNYKNELAVKISNDVKKNLQSKLSESEPLVKVTKLIKVRLLDFFTAKHALLTIWRPSEDDFNVLQENRAYEFFNLIAAGTRDKIVQLSTTKQTRYQVSNQLDPSNDYLRAVTPIEVIDSPGFSPAFGEIDVVGVVVLVKLPEQTRGVTVVYLSDLDGHFLSITFWTSLSIFGCEDSITEGAIVCCCNLQWRLVSSNRRIPSVFASEITSFSLSPKESHLHRSQLALKSKLAEKDVDKLVSSAKCHLAQSTRTQVGLSPAPSRTSSPSVPLRSRSCHSPVLQNLKSHHRDSVPPLSPIPLIVTTRHVFQSFKSPCPTPKCTGKSKST